MPLTLTKALAELHELAAQAEHMASGDVKRRLINDFLRPDMIEALAPCDDVQLVQAWERLKLVHGCKGPVSSIVLAIKGLRKEYAESYSPREVRDGEGQSMQGVLRHLGCPFSLAEDYDVPTGWQINGGQLWRESAEMSPSVIARDIIAPISRARDVETGAITLELAWRYCGHWTRHSTTRKRALTKDGLLELAGVGAPVAQQTASALTSWIDACDHAMSGAPLDSMERMGWTPNGDSFLLATPEPEREGEASRHTPGSIGAKCLLVPPGEGEAQTMARYHAKGSMRGWHNRVWSPCQGEGAEIVVLASLAAPLLYICQAEGWTLDIGGEKGTGKSTSQRAAASVWGAGDMPNWPKTWAGCRNAVEFRADLPTILDDTKHVRSWDHVRDILYQVASEQSQVLGAAGGGTRRGRLVRTIVISSGEAPIATRLQSAQGAGQRILTMGRPPFRPGMPKLVQSIDRATKEHYGIAGPRLVRWLQRHRDSWPQLRERYWQLVNARIDAANGEQTAGRLALRIALLDLVCEIVPEALGLDPTPGCVDRFWHHALHGAYSRDVPSEALREVLGYVYGEPGTVVGFSTYNRDRGTITAVDGCELSGSSTDGAIGLTPKFLRRTLKELGYDMAEITRQWMSRGWLRTGTKNGKDTPYCRASGPKVGQLTLYVVLGDARRQCEPS